MTWDYSLEESTGVVRAHRPDCPQVRALAALGEPVATLLGCASRLPADIATHACLEEDERQRE